MKALGKIAALVTMMALALALTACGGSSSASSAASSSSESVDPATLKGAVADNLYTNDHFGVVFATPEDWSYITDKGLTGISEYGVYATDGLTVDMICAPEDLSMAAITCFEPITEANKDQTDQAHLYARAQKLLQYMEDAGVKYESKNASLNFEGYGTIPAAVAAVFTDDGIVTIGLATEKTDEGFLDIVAVGPTPEYVAAIFACYNEKV